MDDKEEKFSHPGFIDENYLQVFALENLNFDHINTPNPKDIKFGQNQEISGSYVKQNSQTTKHPIIGRASDENANIIDKLDKQNNAKKTSFNLNNNEEPKSQSFSKQESEKNAGFLGCLKQFFRPKRKYDKIRVYFGPNATQDAIYKHPNNNVRTTK